MNVDINTAAQAPQSTMIDAFGMHNEQTVASNGRIACLLALDAIHWCVQLRSEGDNVTIFWRANLI